MHLTKVLIETRNARSSKSLPNLKYLCVRDALILAPYHRAVGNGNNTSTWTVTLDTYLRKPSDGGIKGEGASGLN